jgi:glycosyltransferase involved in cell wall biosynthesis
MVRVLFLASPFKAREVLKMAENFSPEITYKIVTMSYPYSEVVARNKSRLQKARDLILGDKSLTKVIADFRPNIAYSDSGLYGTQFGIASYRLRKRTPLILRLRGDWWREYCDLFSSVSWKRKLFLTQNYGYHWASVILAARVAPVCRWLETVVKHHVPGKRTEVVYLGVSPEDFFPENGFDFHRPAVAIIQNHTVRTKVLGLIRFREVIQRMPNVNFYISEGENVKQTFLPLVKNHFSNVPNAHLIPGVNTLSGVRRMLTAADCYVLASGLDCCPATVLEASLMRKPVVASRVGGVPETILEGRTGWTVSNDDTTEWVHRIELAVTDTKLNQRMGIQGREWVSRKFSWEIIADQVEVLLKVHASK